MSLTCRMAGLLLVAGAVLASPARADLRSGTASPIDLTAGAQTVDPAIDPIASPAASSVVIVERVLEQAWIESIPTLVARAASGTGVPSDLLLNLLKRESGLNRLAVSAKGALGIAQFMPATAAERGLADPFDPAQAIPKAAELLRDLRTRYGNWGLATAAYNAGPGRIDAWLLGRQDLPSETQEYVAKVTGIDVMTWAAGQRPANTIWLLQAAPTYMSLGYEASPASLQPPRRKAGSIGLNEPGLSPPDPSARPPLTTAQLRAAAGGSASPKAGRSTAGGPCSALLTSNSTCLVFSRY